ncbi:MAG: hypothetical protein QXI49_05485 [Candidatus Methanomethylicaceae archaeon]
MYKLTVKLKDEYREKIEFLKNFFNLDTSSLISKLIDLVLEKEKQDIITKLELRIEELATRLAFLEDKLKKE